MKPLNVKEVGVLDYFYVDEHLDRRDLCDYKGDLLYCFYHSPDDGPGRGVNAHASYHCGEGLTKVVVVVYDPDELPRCEHCPDENSGSAVQAERAGVVVGGEGLTKVVVVVYDPD